MGWLSSIGQLGQQAAPWLGAAHGASTQRPACRRLQPRHQTQPRAAEATHSTRASLAPMHSPVQLALGTMASTGNELGWTAREV